MKIDQLLKMGAEVFQKSELSGTSGSNVDMGALVSALGGLLGDGDKVNIGALLENFQGSGLSEIVGSWLGDGANGAIAPNQVAEVLGKDTLSDFAAKLGVSENEAAGGLSDALPQIIDKASSGGSLLDSIGGLDDVIGIAGKFFK